MTDQTDARREQARSRATGEFGAQDHADPGVVDVPPFTWQTPAPLAHRGLSASNRSARELVRFVTDKLLDLDPPYQRGQVWSVGQQLGLIRSFLEGVPIPAVIVNDRFTPSWDDDQVDRPGTGSAMWAMIDGKQRLSAAKAFFDGDLPIPASWVKPEFLAGVEETSDGPYVRYPTLTEVGQRLIANKCLIPVCEAKVSSVAAEADLYLLVNGAGTPQSEEDLARAMKVGGRG